MFNTHSIIFRFALAAVFVGLSGCLPEDELVAPIDRGDVRAATVTMGGDYAQRVYFDLGSNRSVKSVDFALWDLEFNCRPGRYDVRLNSAKFASVADLGAIEFSDVNAAMIKNAEFRYDIQSGDVDSSGIGAWWRSDEEPGAASRKHVYLLDRGYSAAGEKNGLALFRIESADDKSYSVSLANIDGSDTATCTVKRNDSFNYIGFDFDNKAEFEHEPPRESWDLVFTKYVYVFYQPEPLPYSVNGALSNPGLVSAAEFNELPYELIDRETAAAVELNTRPDAIGYDWKTFILQESLYIVDSSRSYIVRDAAGFLYKLRFTDFYDPESGDKGSPAFEFQRL